MKSKHYALLRGDPTALVHLSKTGQLNKLKALNFSSYVSDRILLVFTLIWLGIRIRQHISLANRPDSLYHPEVWMGKLLFPTYPSETLWWTILIFAFVSLLICFLRSNALFARVGLAITIMFLHVSELGFGEVRHTNHLLVLAHFFSVFRPIYSLRKADKELGFSAQALAFEWYQVGLLMIYTMSGCWKFFDMTIRSLIRPGPTWLHPDAVIVTAITNLRELDLPLSSIPTLQSFQFIFPTAYLLLAFAFTPAVLGAFRRPLMLYLYPSIVLFHILNIFTIKISFLPAIFVAAIVFLPYEFIFSRFIGLERVDSTDYAGSGANARYTRKYANGEEDVFLGHVAIREHLWDRLPFIGYLFYYPGIALMGSYLSKRGENREAI